MVTKTYVIGSSEGLHARPAMDFCDKAQTYESEIILIKDGEEYDGKSILAVMCMGAGQGETIELKIDGTDEEQALKGLLEVLDRE